MISLSIYPPKIWSWKSHQGYGRRSFNPLYKEREYMQYEIKKQYKDQPINCAVKIEYEFLFEPPTSISKKKRLEMISGKIFHTKKIDVTNMVKFQEDTLKGVVIVDDCQVVEMTAIKRYAEKCSIIIRIFPLDSSCSK